MDLLTPVAQSWSYEMERPRSLESPPKRGTRRPRGDGRCARQRRFSPYFRTRSSHRRWLGHSSACDQASTHCAAHHYERHGERPGDRAEALIYAERRTLRIGLLRAAAHLRRLLPRARPAEPVPVSVADLTRFAETFADLDDPEVMERAWR
jgi:hypothetical protein